MRVLIVEDQEKLALSVKKGLEQAGYAVDALHDGISGLHRMEAGKEEYDVVILDVMLPGMNGIDICRSARGKGIMVPIMLLTARDLLENKVEGLDAGADDYLVKPFALEELLARLRALLRRPAETVPEVLSVGGLVMDTGKHIVTKNGSEVHLSTKEFAILEQFMRHPNEILSREKILGHVWDFASDSFSNVVDAQIKNLRRKLQHTDEKLFETIHGVGYRFIA